MKRSTARASLEGVTFYSPSEAYFGFTLITPVSTKAVWLIDMAGKTIKQWNTDHLPTADCKLLANGNLLFAGKVERGPLDDFEGAGGVVQELDPDGNVVWEHRDPYLHHRCCRLANGNTLVLKWVEVPAEVATKVAGGFQVDQDDKTMWSDAIEEVTPAGQVVWLWNAHEHLDPKEDSICLLCSRREWTHATCVEAFGDDKILVNFMRTCQIAIVDKTTGQIEWKWGKTKVNHQNYATMLRDGRLLVFDNGRHIAGEVFGYSRPVYVDREKGEIVGGYEEDPPFFFFSSFLGNAQKLPNGCTLMTEGTRGHLLEVSFRNSMVWEYYSPHWADSDQWGTNNFVAGAYRYGLDDEGLRNCLGMEGKWRNWIDVIGEPEKEKAKPARSQADAIRDRLANLGY